MKPTILFLVASLLTLPVAAEVLTNEKIISMLQSGLSPEAITALITTSGCAFDTSTDAIIALTNAKVPSAVIKAMVGKQCTTATPATSTATSNPQTPAADPTAFLESDELVRLRKTGARGWEGFLRIDKTGVTFCCRGNYYYAQSARGMCGDSFKLPLDQLKGSYLYAHGSENPEWMLVTVADVGYRFYVQPTQGVFRAKNSAFITNAFETLQKLVPGIPSERLEANAFNKLLDLAVPSMEGHSFCDEQWNVAVK